MMQLTSLCLTLVCLHLSPYSSQLFRYSTINISCGKDSSATVWKVKRRTLGGSVTSCSSGWGSSLSSSSTCVIGHTYPSDSGLYWCESDDGRQSLMANITISDKSVVLESPPGPVPEGSNVTLRCRTRTASSSERLFSFYKDGHLISSSSTAELSIYNVSTSDQGLYRCHLHQGDQSLHSLLQVQSHVFASPEGPASSCAPPAFTIIRHLLVGSPFLLSTIFMTLVHRNRNQARNLPERTLSDDVIMEVVS
ncbi:Fc receptor-like protein 5 isoform X2 [Cynoglossus semilaevis]|uniref:Fc receptor-like protein 5 isoform X2 n=1 Tax=Cynoglossus semilaevis TaxID=244447 RepID=UPI0007DCB822|nr:Fc receptor-like protein 5 isoform X2 [Cynoglossus semilaevis]XP_024918862.1 Fc receptor-like protein 5 isoform X2 [Cynoglossus semilaevis]